MVGCCLMRVRRPGGPGRLGRRGCRWPLIEPLEQRLLLSAYYNFDVIAKTGDADTAGNTISSIDLDVSVNHSGNVAFVANVSGGATGKGLMVGNGTAASRNVAFSPSLARQYSFAQINDSDQVAARDAISGHSLVRTWDANNPGAFNIVAGTTDGAFAAVLLPTVANDGGFGFVALNDNLDSSLNFNATGVRNMDAELLTLSGGGFRPMAANNSNIVIRNGSGTTGDVILFEGLTRTTLASTTSGWTSVGRSAGISENGEVVVWMGDRGNGPGVFASVREPGGTRKTIVVAGEADTNGDGSINASDSPLPELGYTQSGMNVQNIYFKAINTENRIGVSMYQNPGGNPTAVDPGEQFVVTFIGTPSQASRNNPQTGNPMLFSASEGLWTVHVNAQSPLGTAGATEYNKSSAIPVVQVGDTIGGQVVTALATHDPIAIAEVDTAGMARTVNPGDHYLAFFAQTAGGQMVVRATQLDSDNDGLFDHWETTGVDVDQDGAIDLNLPSIGAQVNHKDVFLEIDWLRRDSVTGISYAPQPSAINSLVTMYANAPVNNPDGMMGITAHIDAGASLNRNMSAGGGAPAAINLQGGDQIAQVGNGNHIHVLYFGVDGSVMFPGMMDARGRQIETRSVESIKQTFFGTTTKFARDLAFHYVVMGDMFANPTNGASGLSEITWYPGSNNTIPGNDFLVTLQGSRDPATLTVPLGGPPATVPTPVGFLQSQTLAHELGHNLGLQHGGVNSVTSNPPGWATFNMANYKPTYRSVMNYSYQFAPDTAGAIINSYSTTGDAVFDDWSNIKLNFPLYLDNINNTFGKNSRMGAPPIDADLPEPTIEEIEQIHGPLENSPPTIVIDAPGADDEFLIGHDLTVTVTATDNIAVESVAIEFDLNGDGTIDTDTERLIASSIGADQYRATFTSISGYNGTRDLSATSYDSAEFETTQTISLAITGSFVLGDMDGSGTFDAFDVDDFELALADKPAYIASHPGIDPDFVGDIDRSGALDAFDVDNFEILLASVGATAPLAPSTPTEITTAQSPADDLTSLNRLLGGTDFGAYADAFFSQPKSATARDTDRWRHIRGLLAMRSSRTDASQPTAAQDFADLLTADSPRKALFA